MDRVLKVIVLPDLQVPFQDARALRAVEAYMADERWDEWVQLGDFMDFDQISRWNKDKPEALARGLVKDYAIANAILDRHQAIVRRRNSKAKFTLISGNHDIRAEKFAEEHPQLRGLIEMEHNLGLRRRKIKYVRSWPKGELHKIGKAYFSHGIYAGANVAKKHVEAFGVNIFFGHVHSIESHSKTLWGTGKAIIGQSLGCLCYYNLDYVGKNPKNWQQAVTTFIFLPNGQFSYFISRIHGGEFIAPNGKVYRG